MRHTRRSHCHTVTRFDVTWKLLQTLPVMWKLHPRTSSHVETHTVCGEFGESFVRVSPIIRQSVRQSFRQGVRQSFRQSLVEQTLASASLRAQAARLEERCIAVGAASFDEVHACCDAAQGISCHCLSEIDVSPCICSESGAAQSKHKRCSWEQFSSSIRLERTWATVVVH